MEVSGNQFDKNQMYEWALGAVLHNCYEKISEQTVENIKRGKMPSVEDPEIVEIYTFTKETFSSPDFSI